MSRSLRRGGSAAIVLALAAVSLSACAAGTSSATLQVKPDVPAASAGTDLKLNGIVAVVGATQQAGQPGPANVTLSISNTGNAPETLQSLTVAGTSATFKDADGAASPSGIVIPAMGSVTIGSTGQPSATLADASLPVGGFAPATFTFSSAGKVDTQMLIAPGVGYYQSYAPTAPSAAPTATGTGTGAASAPASPTGSPTGSPTAAGSPATTASATASHS